MIRFVALLLTVMVALPSFAKVDTKHAQCHVDATSAYQAMMNEQLLAKKKARRININTASASDFLTLKGVGVNTAERIVKYRTQIGRFGSVDDLMKVKGIGQATLDKNRKRLSVVD